MAVAGGAGSANNKVLSITMLGVDKLSPTMKAAIAIVKSFQAVGIGAFKAITLPITAMIRAVSSLLSPLGLLRSAMGFLAVRGMAGFFTATAQAADQIDELATRLGMSRTALQEWAHVAEMQGVQIDTLVTGWSQMADAIASVADGASGSAASAFERLRLDAAALLQLAPEEQFQAIARALEQIGNITERTQLARDLLGGRTGGAFLRVLNQGWTSIRVEMEKAHKLGRIMSDQDIAQSVRLDDAIQHLQQSFIGLRNSIAVHAFPALTQMLDSVTNWVSSHRPRIADFFADTLEDLATLGLRVQAFGNLMRDTFSNSQYIMQFRETLAAMSRFAITVAKETIIAIALTVSNLGELLFEPLIAAGRIAGAEIGKAIRAGLLSPLISSDEELLAQIGYEMGDLQRRAEREFPGGIGAMPPANQGGFLRQMGDLEKQALEISNRMRAPAAAIAKEWTDAVGRVKHEMIEDAGDISNAWGAAGTAISKAGSDLVAQVKAAGFAWRELFQGGPFAFLPTMPFLKWAEAMETARDRARTFIAGPGVELPQSMQNITTAVEASTKAVREFKEEVEEEPTTFGGGFDAAATKAWEDMQNAANAGRAMFDSVFGAFNSGIDSMIDQAFQGTLKIADSFKQMAKSILAEITKILVKWAAVKIVMGLFGASAGAGQFGGGIQAAGGGTFMTRGPTHLTVGDNPGGRELVSVMPIGGRGRTRVSGNVLKMAGGGMVDARGFDGESRSTVNQFEVNIYAADAQSFARMMARPEGKDVIINVVEKAIRGKSTTKAAINKVRR